jgi:hypothetical protein
MTSLKRYAKRLIDKDIIDPMDVLRLMQWNDV